MPPQWFRAPPLTGGYILDPSGGAVSPRSLLPVPPDPPSPLLPPLGPAPSDADLVRRCLDGDRVAWADLLSRYGDLVYGLLRRAGLDADSCADGFQDVSVLLWKGMRRLKNADSLLPWIATTTRRVSWRRKKRATAHAKREAAVAREERDPGPAPEEGLAALEEEQAVRRAMSAIHERCRRLLRALYFEESEGGYDEIARRLGIPRGSIGPTRARCLEALKKELAALGVGPEVSRRPIAASTPAAGEGARRPGPA